MSYKLIVFDWDGTLYNSAEHIVKGVRESAQAAGLIVPSPEDARQVIGLNFEMALLRLFPDMSKEQAEEFEKHYLYWKKNSTASKPQLFQGALEVLAHLKWQGYLLGIITGKHRKGLLEDLQEFRVASYFKSVRCGDDGPSKPHPKLMEEIIEEMGVEPQHVLMIGDTTYDMLLAKNAGTDAFGVSYGVHTEEVLKACEPKRIIHHIEELLDIL